MIALTCNVGSAWLERRIQMRIDHCALFRPLTKHTQVLTADSVDQAVLEALQLACAEPPGPVHLTCRRTSPWRRSRERPARLARAIRALPECSESALGLLEAAMHWSRRPLLITGLGAARLRSPEHVRQFVERHHIPFVSTLHAKGVVPESHPLWCGVLGRARRTTVQRLVRQADLIIALGYDPVEINYEEWIGATPLVHVDWQAADVRPTSTSC